MKSKYILTILLFALFISITFNFSFFKKAVYYHKQINEIRLDPLGLSYFPTSNNQIGTMNPEHKRIVFFGDSRAKDWIFPISSGQFQFINRGIAGQTSQQVNARFDYHIKPFYPHIIVLQVGINDLKVIPFFPDKKESVITNCKKNIAEIVSKSLDLGSTVILTTIFPIGSISIERRFYWSDDVVEAITDVNKYLYDLESRNVSILDTGAILKNEEGIVRKEYSKDFLHLTTEGYAALNSEVMRIINEVAP